MFNNIGISEKIIDDLTAAVKNGRLSHAIILEGADEEKRLLAAKELAMAILCTGEDKPCGICPSCIKVKAESHPDLHFLQKAKENASIKVDEIRELKHKASLLPNDGSKSVFIIHEGQNMLIPSQNALLKIFEEPAKHVNFIITCPSKSCFLETITSRGSSYSLGNENSAELLNNEESSQKANELLGIFADKNEFDFLCAAACFQKDKELFESVLDYMCIILRDALIYTGNEDKVISSFPLTAKKLTFRLTEKQIIECIDCIYKILENFRSSANYNLTVTRLTSELYGIKTK